MCRSCPSTEGRRDWTGIISPGRTLETCRRLLPAAFPDSASPPISRTARKTRAYAGRSLPLPNVTQPERGCCRRCGPRLSCYRFYFKPVKKRAAALPQIAEIGPAQYLRLRRRRGVLRVFRPCCGPGNIRLRSRKQNFGLRPRCVCGQSPAIRPRRVLFCRPRLHLPLL